MSAESASVISTEGARSDFLGTYVRGPWAIAAYTWKEGIRKKTLIGFLLLSLLVIFGSTFMTAFMANTTAGAETEVQTKIIKDICVSAIAIFGVLITIFISASVVPTELENKVVYTILSKPIRRYQYLAGKFLGVQLIVIANLVLMSLLFAAALYAKERIVPTLLFWSTLLTYFQFLIISAFTFAISCTSTSSVLPTISGLFIYIAGNLTEYLKDVYIRVGESEQFFDRMIANVAWGLYKVLPNLRSFDLKDQILYLQSNDPPKDIMIPNLIAYGVLFAAVGYLLAWVLFSRKEL
ncbi:MAG: ABC transporter permease subunit [Candidatus Hydrogenedentes bacterium]|nr:ABC transporter permease subunit [Candidatus Hydrogenedentota bacterium]